MTESEWEECTEPLAMLKALRKSRMASSRKLRLLACACCREVGSLLANQTLREAVETAERYADDEARYIEMVHAAKAVEAFSRSASESERLVADGVWHLVTMGVWWNLSPGKRTERTIRSLLIAERDVAAMLASLVRCLFGDSPFRPAIIASFCRTARAVSLARSIYAERTWERMPALLDTLEDAGCTDVAILEHLRKPGPHARGCWPVDLLLSRE